MNIVYKNTVEVSEYRMLRELVGWTKLCEDQAKICLLNSDFIISAYDTDNVVDGKNQIVGMTRLFGDGGYAWYIADVIVYPDYRGKGFGKKLVQTAIDYIKSQIKPEWEIKIILISALGKQGFYKKLGFVERKEENNLGPGMQLVIKSIE